MGKAEGGEKQGGLLTRISCRVSFQFVLDADGIEFVCSRESSRQLFVVSQNTAADNDTVGTQNGGVPSNLGMKRALRLKAINTGTLTKRLRREGEGGRGRERGREYPGSK